MFAPAVAGIAGLRIATASLCPLCGLTATAAGVISAGAVRTAAKPAYGYRRCGCLDARPVKVKPAEQDSGPRPRAGQEAVS
jgi:hypothetical protein